MKLSAIKQSFEGKVCAVRRRLGQRNRLQELVQQGVVEIGPHTYGAPRVDIYKGSPARVVIGPYCSISRGVVLVTGGVHPVAWVSTYPFRIKWDMPGAYRDGTPETRGDIRIGPDVWIGTDAMIMSGVTVGPGAIIAARSVVTRDVPAYGLVVGVPAKLVRHRFSDAQIESLLKIQWWNWPEEKVRDAVPLLCSSNIDDFIGRYQ